MRKVLYLPLILMLTACAALGVPKADTFNKQVVVANGLVESAATTAASLYAAGKISDDARADVYNQGTQARASIEIVRQLHATDPLTAENRLNTIIVALTALQAKLEAKE